MSLCITSCDQNPKISGTETKQWLPKGQNIILFLMKKLPVIRPFDFIHPGVSNCHPILRISVGRQSGYGCV